MRSTELSELQPFQNSFQSSKISNEVTPPDLSHTPSFPQHFRVLFCCCTHTRCSTFAPVEFSPRKSSPWPRTDWRCIMLASVLPYATWNSGPGWLLRSSVAALQLLLRDVTMETSSPRVCECAPDGLGAKCGCGFVVGGKVLLWLAAHSLNFVVYHRNNSNVTNPPNSKQPSPPPLFKHCATRRRCGMLYDVGFWANMVRTLIWNNIW